jgi:hypothetical protein
MVRTTRETKSNKILLVLQFWAGDRAAAQRLAAFIADIQESHSAEADFLVVNRFDCDPLDAAVTAALSRKFNVYTYRSTIHITGWPGGCNALWLSAMEWVSSMIEARRVPGYKAIFTFEADGAPIPADWVRRLSTAWDQANAITTVTIAGPMVGGPGYSIHAHINGNCLITGDVKKLAEIKRSAWAVSPTVGWDYALAGWFAGNGWANIPEMRSYYNSAAFSPADYQKMVDENLIWVHGDKSGCLIDYGYRRLMKREI